MSGRTIVTVVLWVSFAFFALLSGLATRELTSDSSCPTGEFDTVHVVRLGREWVPPRMLCQVTLRNGQTHNASVNYWPAFAGLLATGVAATVWTLSSRGRPAAREAGSRR
jgi:hypothetical protein